MSKDLKENFKTMRREMETMKKIEMELLVLKNILQVKN